MTRRAADRLIDHLVRGAAEADAVRLHGAIVAAFELFTPAVARDWCSRRRSMRSTAAPTHAAGRAAAIERHEPLYEA